MAGGEHNGQRAETARKRARIVELRDQGLTFREIVPEVGLSYAAVWNHYQNAMRDIPAAAVDEHRKKLAARLDEQLRRIDMEREAVMTVLAKTGRTVVTASGKVIEDVEDDAAVLTAIDRLVKLDDQEAKLLGLYAKAEVNVSGGVTYSVVGVDMGKLT